MWHLLNAHQHSPHAQRWQWLPPHHHRPQHPHQSPGVGGGMVHRTMWCGVGQGRFSSPTCPKMLPLIKSSGTTHPSQSPCLHISAGPEREVFSGAGSLPSETSLPVASHLGLLDELGDDHRVLLGDSRCTTQESLQIPISVGHIHSSTTQHVGGAHHTGVPHCLAELASRLRA